MDKAMPSTQSMPAARRSQTMPDLKHVQAWGERIGARPGVQKGMKLEN
jgi:hypothetical protein